jgi:hypothetical protein
MRAMRHFLPIFAICSVAWLTGGCGGDTGRLKNGTAADAGAVDATSCTVATDCGWGEIDHEILSRSDCICLLGCPSLPLNKKTVERRLTQYQKLCDPEHDAEGNPCGIDDCVAPPEPTCVDSTCGPSDPFPW